MKAKKNAMKEVKTQTRKKNISKTTVSYKVCNAIYALQIQAYYACQIKRNRDFLINYYCI